MNSPPRPRKPSELTTAYLGVLFIVVAAGFARLLDMLLPDSPMLFGLLLGAVPSGLIFGAIYFLFPWPPTEEQNEIDQLQQEIAGQRQEIDLLKRKLEEMKRHR